MKIKKSRKTNAFTLVELLVVISIIALLLAILIPSLSKAREQGRRVVCLSNTKQISLALILYTEDNSGALVLPRIMKDGVRDEDNVKKWGYWVFPPQDKYGNTLTSKFTIEDEKRGIQKGHMFSYLKNLEVYHCPSDKREATLKLGFRTYSITNPMNGYKSAAWGDVVNRYNQIIRPSERIWLVEEPDTRGYNNGSWAVNPRATYWIDPLAAWHNGNCDFSYADGHSARYTYVDKRSTDFFEKIYQSGKYTNSEPQANNKDLEYVVKSYNPDGVIKR
jgi:prepilin-type N-terminal cleavage/methylation domain-containing protein/prepilin-type processing-associated H-X9-DG protein